MEFIDLALPSGTLWGDRNVADHTAGDLPKTLVPTVAQFAELWAECNKTLITSLAVPHIQFTGKNGNRIFLPLSGYGQEQHTFKDEEATPERIFNHLRIGVGYYRTSVWSDYHNVVMVIDGESLWDTITENTFRLCVRPVKSK